MVVESEVSSATGRKSDVLYATASVRLFTTELKGSPMDPDIIEPLAYDRHNSFHIQQTSTIFSSGRRHSHRMIIPVTQWLLSHVSQLAYLPCYLMCRRLPGFPPRSRVMVPLGSDGVHMSSEAAHVPRVRWVYEKRAEEADDG